VRTTGKLVSAAQDNEGEIAKVEATNDVFRINSRRFMDVNAV